MVKNGRVLKRQNNKIFGLLKPDSLFGYFMILPALVVLSFFFAYPLIYEIYISFTDKTLSNDGEFIGFKNYIRLLDNPEFVTAIFNSAVYVSFVQMCKFTLGLGIAILLNQKMQARGLWRG